MKQYNIEEIKRINSELLRCSKRLLEDTKEIGKIVADMASKADKKDKRLFEDAKSIIENEQIPYINSFIADIEKEGEHPESIQDVKQYYKDEIRLFFKEIKPIGNWLYKLVGKNEEYLEIKERKGRALAIINDMIKGLEFKKNTYDADELEKILSRALIFVGRLDKTRFRLTDDEKKSIQDEINRKLENKTVHLWYDTPSYMHEGRLIESQHVMYEFKISGVYSDELHVWMVDRNSKVIRENERPKIKHLKENLMLIIKRHIQEYIDRTKHVGPDTTIPPTDNKKVQEQLVGAVKGVMLTKLDDYINDKKKRTSNDIFKSLWRKKGYDGFQKYCAQELNDVYDKAGGLQENKDALEKLNGLYSEIMASIRAFLNEKRYSKDEIEKFFMGEKAVQTKIKMVNAIKGKQIMLYSKLEAYISDVRSKTSRNVLERMLHSEGYGVMQKYCWEILNEIHRIVYQSKDKEAIDKLKKLYLDIKVTIAVILKGKGYMKKDIDKFFRGAADFEGRAIPMGGKETGIIKS